MPAEGITRPGGTTATTSSPFFAISLLIESGTVQDGFSILSITLNRPVASASWFYPFS